MDSVDMTLNSEKKHSVRYDADNGDATVTSLYLMKSSTILKDHIPDQIVVTVEER
jgi:hypothetical protein